MHGAKAALREGAGSVKYANTEGAKSRGRSTAGGSMGGRSMGARTSATARGAGSQHSGDRYIRCSAGLSPSLGTAAVLNTAPCVRQQQPTGRFAAVSCG